MIRKLDCYYIPDYIESASIVPVLCFRLDRAGKCIPQKFAERFIGPANCGVLIRARLKDRSIANLEFIENALDYSTIIPYDLLPKKEMHTKVNEHQPLALRVNGHLQQCFTALPCTSEVETAFSDISTYCAARTGDFLALELSDGFSITPDSHLVVTIGEEQILNLLVK